MAVTASPSRREELRAFLRSRRARLTPADVGLRDDGARRRTPGLRREELATLAGVGVSWYTWLEQGRDIHPSPDVLEALARALRLDAAERATLFALARAELPLPAADQDGADEDHALLISLVESLHPTPAYLLGPMTRILAWNGAASALFGSPFHIPAERRSLLWMLLVEPSGDSATRRDSATRKGTARNMVARFRTEYAQHAGEPEYERFVEELKAHSPWFVQWWDEHEVSGTQRGTKTVEHPTLGTLRLHHAQTVPTGSPDLRLTIYAPADEQTRAALATVP